MAECKLTIELDDPQRPRTGAASDNPGAPAADPGEATASGGLSSTLPHYNPSISAWQAPGRNMIKTLLTKFARRPFPRNWHALRSCRISYSQFGEDLFITTLLGYEETEGVFIDVGCYHPIEFSNTYIFSQRGWTGLAIDPNPLWAEFWKKYRPRDHFLNAAVSSTTGEALYLMNRRYSALNKLVSEPPAEGLSSDESLTTIPTMRLDDIADKLLPGKKIDLINIDCEGHDLAVLESIDFSKMRPRVIAVEDLTVQEGSPVSMFLSSRNYACRASIGIAKIFQALE